jgi:fatty acid desaturase
MAASSPDFPAYSDDRLDGSSNVMLAPVRGIDNRRDLPKSLFVKRPVFFTAKFSLGVVLVAGCWAAIAIIPTWEIIIPSAVVLGLVYAHLVELQHECLHEHAYNQRWLNRLVGFICGIPMMSSYWHYKYDHLRHHAYLGTPQNSEFFNYRFSSLDSPAGFARGCFHLGRYLNVLANIGRSLLGRTNPAVTKTIAAKKIRTEYIGFAVVLAVAIAVSIFIGNPLVLFAWVIPALLVAEPTHFLIELPEHFGLNTQSDPNVLSNTRTVTGSRLAKWFTNGNDLHTAHHFHQGVPMARVADLYKMIEDRVETVDHSYWSFYKKVLTGKLRYQDPDETCMTR